MKPHLHLFSFLLVLMTFLAACGKEDVSQATRLPEVRMPTMQVQRSEYFWGRPWHKTSRGYEIHLASDRLTQDAINRGISVGLAIATEMTTFFSIPGVYYDHTEKDSVHISYLVKPNSLEVIAKAPFEIDYVSDVSITYN